MVNRILYWFVTLSLGSKILFTGAFILMFLFACSVLASVPASQRRTAIQANATQAPAQSQQAASTSQPAKQLATIVGGNQAVSTDATATAGAANATQISGATASAQAIQAATTTAIAFAPFATQTAIAESAGPMPHGDKYLYS